MLHVTQLPGRKGMQRGPPQSRSSDAGDRGRATTHRRCSMHARHVGAHPCSCLHQCRRHEEQAHLCGSPQRRWCLRAARGRKPSAGRKASQLLPALHPRRGRPWPPCKVSRMDSRPYTQDAVNQSARHLLRGRQWLPCRHCRVEQAVGSEILLQARCRVFPLCSLPAVRLSPMLRTLGCRTQPAP